MKIVFNLHDVGLGNNGGTRTVIKCAEVMATLGHKVILYTNVPSAYTWHSPVGIKILVQNSPPSCHAVIATGYYSVKSTLKTKADKKFYYIRGFENWNATEHELFKTYRSLNCIVNNTWMHKYLSKYKIKSRLIYQGLDFDKFYILDDVKKRKRIGSLYSERHQTKRHIDAISVNNIVGYKLRMLNKDIINPTEQKLNRWYNKSSVWFAPTELEGLHNPPMEASLAGCGLVCTDHERNGMFDYAIHNETALIYPTRNIKIAAKYVKKLIEDESLRLKLNKSMIKLLKNKIGSREHNMGMFIDYISDI